MHPHNSGHSDDLTFAQDGERNRKSLRRDGHSCFTVPHGTCFWPCPDYGRKQHLVGFLSANVHFSRQDVITRASEVDESEQVRLTPNERLRQSRNEAVTGP